MAHQYAQQMAGMGINVNTNGNSTAGGSSSSSYDESAFAQVGARGSLTGEVRFAERDGAETAILSLNGSLIRGCAIMVQRDDMSKDGTKLIVSNLPHGMQWQQLKDHFSPVGKVAYACIKREDDPISVAADAGDNDAREFRRQWGLLGPPPGKGKGEKYNPY
mmetsp:Transcript_118417/g.313059  ORF Transcript_118417/g.313059 Transcript_118417/m.313059 type:complete len:162 (-) Transcript_118417:214-699(-)